MKHHASPSFSMEQEHGRPAISVIVPAYNAGRCLTACAASLFGQSFGDFELLLIDDGSTDDTAAVMAELARRDARVRLLAHEKNRGLSAARNTGLAEARGGYIAFVDADDEVLPAYLERLYALCASRNVRMAACNHTIVRGGRRTKRFDADAGEKEMTAREAARELLYQRAPDVSCWGKLYSRELFDGLAYPEGRIYEDSWLFPELLLRAERMAYTSEALYDYIQYGDSLSHGSYTPVRMQYVEAVDRLCGLLEKAYPELRDACRARRAHARMSVRRYLVGCKKELRDTRAELDREIRRDALHVMADGETPMRDRIAAAAALAGPWAYDALWTMYEKLRK